MPTYPLVIPMPCRRLPGNYHPAAAGPKVRNQLEDYLNERAKDSPVTVLTYPQIANATGIDKEIVAFLLSPIIWKP